MFALLTWQGLPVVYGDDLLLDESHFDSHIPVVISATKLEQSLADTPAAVTIIDRAMITASGAVEIADLLRLVPGFQVAKSTLDHAPAVTYHGQSDGFPRRMQVLIDGRSAVGAVFSNIDWDGLGVHIDDIERIEVVRGPNSPVYGANAFVAVINIITKQTFQDRGIFVQGAVGSQNTQNAMLRFADNVGSMEFRTTLRYEETNGFDRRNDEKRVRAVDFRGTQSLTTVDLIDVQLGYSEGPLGRGGDYLVLRGVAEKEVYRNYQGFRWDHTFSNSAESSLLISHDYRKENDTASIGLLSDLIKVPVEAVATLFPGNEREVIHWGAYTYTAEKYDLQWRYTSERGSKLRYVWGADWRLDRFKSPLLINRERYVDNNSVRTSLNAEYGFTEKWLLHGGVLIEYSDLYSTDVAPRLAVNYHINSQHTIRMSVTRAYRTPSLLEEFFNYALRFDDGTLIDQNHLSQGGLDSEKMTAYEIGYYGDWFSSRLIMEIRLFREEIRKEIEEVKNNDFPEPVSIAWPGSFERENTGETDINGIETQIQFRPGTQTLVSIQYAYAEAQVRSSINSTRLKNKFSATPRHTISALASYHFSNGIELSATYYSVSDMAWYGDGSNIDTYNRMDARMAYNFGSPKLDYRLELIAQNIGDDYREFRDDNVFESRYLVRVSVQHN